MRKNLFLEMDLTLEPRFTKEFVIKKKDDITLDISLKNENIPVIVDGQIPRLFVRKQDGTVIVQGGSNELGDGSIVIGGNVVRINLKNSATNTTGLCYAELELEDESGVMATHSFIFEVVDRLTDVDEAIKAVDDIYILAEIEKFIIQAKKDIEEIKTALDNFRADMEQAIEDFNLSIEDFRREIEDAINGFNEAVEGITDEIELKREEALSALNESLNNSLLALTVKEEEVLSKIDENYNNALSGIESSKVEAVKVITDAKSGAINEMGIKKHIYLEDIRKKSEEALNRIDVEKNSIVEELKNLGLEMLEEISKKAGETVEDVETKYTECVAQLENKKEEIIENISDVESQALININEVIDNAEDLKADLERLNIASTDLKALIEEIINNGNATKEDILRVEEEARLLKAEIENVIVEATGFKANLEAENLRAEANINELQTLHPEADIRIEELRRLIEEAKQYEEVVRTWIANREPALNLDEVNEQLQELYNAVEAIIVMFDNYYTKEEVDKLIPILDNYAPSKIVGRFGDSQFFHSEKRFIPEGEALLDFEPKHTFQFTYFDSSNYQYMTFYFKCDLDNDPDKYISMDGRKIILNGMTRNIDYVAISGKGTGSTGLQTFTFNETYRISALDFNIYNTDRSTIIIPNPKEAGLNSFNDATTTGIYTIDLPSSSYKTLTGNAPLKSNANTVSGILEVMEIGTNIVQRKTLHSIGEQYVRILGQEWKRIDGNKVNENIAQIKVADIQPIPSIAMSAPKNPFFWNDSTGGYIVFRVKENEYYAIYPYNSTKPLSCYLDNTWVSKYGYNIVFNNSYRETAVFKCADGQTWKSIDDIVSTDRIGEIKYDPDYFRVYCNSHTIYAHPNNGSIYQEPTEMEVNIPITLQDFNEAKTTGTYEIDIKEGDEILNVPISGELKGALLVHIAGIIITQEITDINRTVYERVYNGAEWTEWQEGAGGASNIDLNNFYTKEETDELLSNVEVDLSGYATKEELEGAIVENIDNRFNEPLNEEILNYLNKTIKLLKGGN